MLNKLFYTVLKYYFFSNLWKFSIDDLIFKNRHPKHRLLQVGKTERGTYTKNELIDSRVIK